MLNFLIVSLCKLYGMSTFEGPMMSIKTVNALTTTPIGQWATCIHMLWAG